MDEGSDERSSGDSENDENSHNDENDMQEEQPDQNQADRRVTLSKSWSIESAHVPTFTGGKVTHCYEFKMPRKGENDENDSEEEKFKPFLLLPVDGDLAVVDATRGTKMGTVRGQDANFDEEDEDEGVDQEAITSFCLGRNNQLLMTCTRNHMLRQYSLNTSSSSPVQLVKTWGRSGHTLPVTLMELHPSMVFLATGSIDGTVRVWDVRGSYVTHVFRPLAGGDGGGSGRLSVTALSWRQDASRLILAIGRDDGSMAIHDLRDADHVIVLRDHVSTVTCMEWWGDEFFVSTGRDAVLNLWRIVQVEAEEAKKSKRKKKKQQQEQQQQQQLQLYDVPKVSYRRIQTLPVYEQVEGMVVVPSKDASELAVATAGSKGLVRLWHAIVVAGRTPELKLFREQPQSQAFDEGRGGYMGLVLNELARSAIDNNSEPEKLEEQFIAIDAEHSLSFLSSSLRLDRTIVGHNDEILDLKVIPTAGPTSKVVVATNSPQIRIFELGNFSCTVLDGHTATVLCVAVSPCGRFIASCGKDKTMKLWYHFDKDSRHPRCVATATGHTEAIGACALSQKVGRYEVGGKAARNGGGAFAVTASVDRTLKRWNLPSAEEALALLTEVGDESQNPLDLMASVSVRGHEKDINIVSIAPNDSLVATGSQDKTVKLWNSTDLTLRATLKGHKRGVWDCQFSPIDRVVATSSGDKTVKLWSLGDYSCVRTFQGHVASALRVRFLTGGLQLMSAGADGLLKLWTIRTNECEATLDGHTDRVWALDLKTTTSATGEEKATFVSGGADSKLVVWEDNTQEVEDDKRAKEAESIMLDQKLANHLRHKEFDKALEIALQVDKPMQALKVMTSIIEHDLQQKRQNGLLSLQRHVEGWTMERTTQVLKYCREWNTRALNCHVAMLVLKAVVTTVPAATLASADGVPEILAGILPYAERHFDRLDRLYTSSYLLDFSLVSVLGSLDPPDDTADKSETEFESWQATSKLVLPPKTLDGRIQVGGKDIVGGNSSSRHHHVGSDSDGDDGDDVVTVGDSSTSSSDNSDSSEDEVDNEEKKWGRGRSQPADEGSESSQGSSSS